MGLIFTPALVRHILRTYIGPLGLSEPIRLASTSRTRTYLATPNGPIGRYNTPPAAHPLTPSSPTPPCSHPPTPLYTQSVLLQ